MASATISVHSLSHSQSQQGGMYAHMQHILPFCLFARWLVPSACITDTLKSLTMQVPKPHTVPESRVTTMHADCKMALNDWDTYGTCHVACSMPKERMHRCTYLPWDVQHEICHALTACSRCTVVPAALCRQSAALTTWQCSHLFHV